MTDRELADLLRRNPDVTVDNPYVYPPVTKLGYIVKLSEHDLQAAIIAECDRRAIMQPEFGLIYAIPNGQYRQGQRMEPGLRPGVPDLMLPVARGGYHGMYLELKCGANKPSEAQLEWMSKLKAEGYRVVTAWDSVDAAMCEIESYLEG